MVLSTTPIELSKAAAQLIEALAKENKEIAKLLVELYKGSPISPDEEESVYNYFLNHSVITAATAANPGSSMTTEYLYEGFRNAASPIDQYFLEAIAGQAVKERLIAIEKNLPIIVEKHLGKRKEILIGNFGSGPGRDIIHTLFHYRDNNVKAVCIDKDGKALERGIREATKLKINHLIDFVQADFLHYKPREQFDIGLLIGVLCPLPAELCRKYLRIINGKLLKPRGFLIASNASKKMLEEDPFTCFIMKWTSNWILEYKDEAEIKQLFEDTGFRWQGIFTDPFGFHIMGTGVAES